MGKLSFLAMCADHTEIEIHTFHQYVRDMRAALNAQKRSFDDHLNKQKKKMSAEEFESYCDFQSDQYWQLTETFPRLMRESTFVAIMSFVESELVRTCHVIESRRSIPIKYKKLARRTTLESVREYVKAHTAIDIGAQRRWKNFRYI
jgi:hypothetical protein